jgi:hypothetical protein
MSLQDLKIAELRALGDQFGVDLSDVKTKAAVIEELEVLGMNLGNGLLDRPKLPLTLLTKGIYFSLEVEVSRT